MYSDTSTVCDLEGRGTLVVRGSQRQLVLLEDQVKAANNPALISLRLRAKQVETH